MKKLRPFSFLYLLSALVLGSSVRRLQAFSGHLLPTLLTGITLLTTTGYSKDSKVVAYRSNDVYIGYDLVVKVDDTFVAAGSKGNQLFLGHFNETLDMQWGVVSADNRTHIAHGVANTTDSMYAVAGYTREQADLNSFLMKFNATGYLKWSLLYGGDGSQAAYDAVGDDEGNIMTVGFSSSFQDANDMDAHIVQVDPNGAFNWGVLLGGNFTDAAFAVTFVPVTEHYLITGSYSYDSTTRGLLVARVNKNGRVLFADSFRLKNGRNRFYGSPTGYGIVSARDGSGYMVVGATHDRDSTNRLSDMFMVYFNSSDHLLWGRAIGRAQPDAGLGVVELRDGWLAAGMFTFYNRSVGLYFVKLDKEGEFKFSRTFQGTNFNVPTALGITDDYRKVMVTGAIANKDLDSIDLMLGRWRNNVKGCSRKLTVDPAILHRRKLNFTSAEVGILAQEVDENSTLFLFDANYTVPLQRLNKFQREATTVCEKDSATRSLALSVMTMLASLIWLPYYL